MFTISMISLFLKYKPTRVVFYCGENDLWSRKPVSQVMKDFVSLWTRLEKDLPKCSPDLPFLQTIPQTTIQVEHLPKPQS